MKSSDRLMKILCDGCNEPDKQFCKLNCSRPRLIKQIEKSFLIIDKDRVVTLEQCLTFDKRDTRCNKFKHCSCRTVDCESRDKNCKKGRLIFVEDK